MLLYIISNFPGNVNDGRKKMRKSFTPAGLRNKGFGISAVE